MMIETGLKYLLITLLIFSQQLLADNYELSPTYFQTSDNFYFNQFRLDYSGFRSNTWWPYVNEPENGAGWTAHASVLEADTPIKNIGAYQLQLGIHNKRSLRNSWTMRLGAIQLSEEGRDDFLDTTFFIQSKGSWTNTSWYSLEFFKDYLFMERLILAGPQDQLRSYGIRPSFLFNGWENQRIFYKGHYSQMDHDNLRTESDLQWMYGISQNKPWFWMGMGASYLSFSEQNANYWSPEQFHSFGPRSEVAHTIGSIQASAGFNYSFHREKGFDSGEGFYTTLSLQYGKRESNHIRLTATAMESTQGSNNWRASSLQLFSLLQF